MRIKHRKLELIRDEILREKFITDQIKIGLRNQIRSIRDDRNLTQKELAKLIGISQSVVSRIERNTTNVNISTLLKIAKVLDVALVVRFEAIDTYIDWYSNLTQKKMTPKDSKTILNEIDKIDEVLSIFDNIKINVNRLDK